MTTKPYTLHRGDCIAVMRGMPDNSVDMIMCDPPYGTTRNAWDSVISLDDMWEQIRRIMKPGGAIVFTASQPFTSALVMSNPAWFRHEWIWHKNKASGHLNSKRAPMKSHESVLVFASKAPTYHPQMTVGHDPMSAYYTSNNGRNYGDGKMMAGGGATQRYPRTVQDFSVVNNSDPEKTHPTQKPVDLIKYMLLTYSNAGETVLDFTMGSGTTGVACLETGRIFVGIELGVDEMEIASARILRKHQAITADAVATPLPPQATLFAAI